MKSGFIWHYNLLFCPPGRCQKSVLFYPGRESGVVSSRGWLERGSSLSSSLTQGHVLPKLSPQPQSWGTTCPSDFARKDTNLTGQNFPLGKLLVFYQVLLHIEMISHFCILWSANFESLVRSSTGTWGHCFMVMRGAEGASVLVRLTCPRKSPTQTWWVRPSVAMAMSYNKTAVRNWNVVWWQRATRAPCSAVLRKAPHRRWHLLWDLAGGVWSLSALSHTCWFQSPIL